MTDEQPPTKVCANPDCRIVFERKPKMPPSRWLITKYHTGECGKKARRAAAAAPKPALVEASVLPSVTRPMWRPAAPGWPTRPGDAGYGEVAS